MSPVKNPFHSLRRFRESGPKERPPFVIFLGGGWGAGKSTSAVMLASTLGIANVIHTDVLRSCLRVSNLARIRKIVKPATYATWKVASRTLSEKSLQQGLRMQSIQVRRCVFQIIREVEDFGKDTVIEGIHLLPGLYKQYAQAHKCCLLCLDVGPDTLEERIRARCRTTYRRRAPERYLSTSRYSHLCMLNQIVRSDARRYEVPVLDMAKGDQMCKCLDILKQYLQSLSDQR